LLGGGLQQRLDVDVQRAEADAQLIEAVAVGLVEMAQLRGDSAAGQLSAGVDQHRGQGSNAGTGRCIARDRG